MILAGLAAFAASLAAGDYQKANDLFQKEQFGEASEALNRALQQDPTYIPAWTLRGRMAMAFNRFDIARAAFLKAVQLDASSPHAQFMLGFFYYVDNDFTRAVPALETAARLNPADARALLYLAMSNEGLAKPELALDLYQKTIALEAQLHKPSPETHTAYGRLLFSLGRMDESATQVARVLDLDPKSRDGHYERGRIAFERGDAAGAVADGEKALGQPGKGTTDRQIQFLLARAYAKLGRSEDAAAHRKLFEQLPMTLRR
jgi:Flp pilus assembly protein TadD